MTFARIWIAILAGACVAVPGTLIYTASSAVLAVRPLEREALNPGFLIIWAALSILLVVPTRQRNQWLLAIWLTAACFGLLCALSIILSGPVASSVIAFILCALLGGLAQSIMS